MCLFMYSSQIKLLTSRSCLCIFQKKKKKKKKKKTLATLYRHGLTILLVSQVIYITRLISVVVSFQKSTKHKG